MTLVDTVPTTFYAREKQYNLLGVTRTEPSEYNLWKTRTKCLPRGDVGARSGKVLKAIFVGNTFLFCFLLL